MSPQALEAFFRDMWAMRFDVEGIQEAAVKHGLAEERQVTASCGKDCNCVAYGFPATCIRIKAAPQAAPGKTLGVAAGLAPLPTRAELRQRIAELEAALDQIRESAVRGAWGEGTHYEGIVRAVDRVRRKEGA